MTTANIPQQPLPVPVELLQCLDEFSRHTQAIFDDLSKSTAQQQQSASTGSIPYATALASLAELSYTDEKLAHLLNKAEVHTRNQKRIQELEDQLVQHEIEWRKEVNTLESERKRLKAILDRGKKDKEAIEQARKGRRTPAASHV